jgi:hypothetical protein
MRTEGGNGSRPTVFRMGRQVNNTDTISFQINFVLSTSDSCIELSYPNTT